MNFTTDRRLSKTRLALSFLVLALLMAAPSASAHTHPVEMMPAANAMVGTPPNITIHFSEPLEPKFSLITVTDAMGRVVNKEPSVVGADTKIMTVPLPVLAPGVYTVNWVGVSVDTHRTQGEYKFTVK
jgi:copper resistance protein C